MKKAITILSVCFLCGCSSVGIRAMKPCERQYMNDLDEYYARQAYGLGSYWNVPRIEDYCGEQ